MESYSAAMDADALIGSIYARRRRGLRVDDPFAAFGDLAKVRFVTRTRDESRAICEVVEREFDVDSDLTMTFADADARNAEMAESGYEGRVAYDFPRIVVSLTEERSALPEWRELDGLRAEIGVLTLLQRAWLDLDYQNLPYVSDASYPDEVRRSIVRAASLLADADGDLSSIPETTDRAEDEYERAFAAGDLDRELNVSSLRVYLRDAEIVTRLAVIAENAGMAAYDEDVLVDDDDLWVVRRSGCSLVRDLDQLLREAEPRAADLLGRLCKLMYDDEAFVPWTAPPFVVSCLLLSVKRADSELVALTPYLPVVRRALNALIGNPPAR